MAQKRMISKQIIDSDAFLDMPLSAQALYFHLAIRADDDGFIGNGKALARSISASSDDLKLLIAKGFLFSFDSGVVAVAHWRIHNYISKDRYTPTVFSLEKSQLTLLPTKAYGLKDLSNYPQDNPQGIPQSIPQGNINCIQPVYSPTTSCIQSVGADIDIDKDIDSDIDMSTSVRARIHEETDRTETKQNDDLSTNKSTGFSTGASPLSKADAIQTANAVGDLFKETLPSLPYTGVTERLIVEIGKAAKPVDYYRKVFERAAKSSWLCAPRPGANWCCSLDWLCKPANAEKVLAGDYDDFAKPGKSQVAPERKGVTIVNGVESGFDTESMFEAALRRSWQAAEQDPEILERMLNND